MQILKKPGKWRFALSRAQRECISILVFKQFHDSMNMCKSVINFKEVNSMIYSRQNIWCSERFRQVLSDSSVPAVNHSGLFCAVHFADAVVLTNQWCSRNNLQNLILLTFKNSAGFTDQVCPCFQKMKTEYILWTSILRIKIIWMIKS